MSSVIESLADLAHFQCLGDRFVEVGVGGTNGFDADAHSMAVAIVVVVREDGLLTDYC